MKMTQNPVYRESILKFLLEGETGTAYGWGPELVINTESSAAGSDKYSLMERPEREELKLF